MKKIIIVRILICSWLVYPISSIAQHDLPEEAIYAHVAKDLTVAGEKIWFAVQALDSHQKPFSKIIYAELINRKGLPVYQTIYFLESGKAEGYLEIPTDLDSDHYLLRFYTRISALKSDKGIYNQFLTVIHPFKPPTSEENSPNNYNFRQPETWNSSVQKIENSIQLVGNEKGEILGDVPEYSVSISIKNPFLPENFTGYIHREIYDMTKTQPQKLIPEPYGHIIHAKNLNTDNDTTETFYLSAHGKQSYLSVAKPDLRGNLYFELGAMKEYSFLIIQSRDGEKQLNVSLESPFLPMELKSDFNFPQLMILEKDKELLLDLVTAGKVNRYFYAEAPNAFLPIATGFASDRSYLLDDYVRFENIETTIREYVPEVYVRKQDRKTIFKVLDNALTSVFKENPLVLLDAMPVFDVDALAKFDPKEIYQLEIMNREFSLHQDKYAGVLSFRSFKNDFGEFPLPSNALYLEYPQLQKSKKPQTVHLNPEIGKPHFPDFRTTLYWNSNQKLLDPIDFKPSPSTGTFQVSISVSNRDGILKYYKSDLE